MHVEAVGSSLVLGTCASVLNEIVDHVFDCADSGQLSDHPVVGELFSGCCWRIAMESNRAIDVLQRVVAPFLKACHSPLAPRRVLLICKFGARNMALVKSEI